MFRILTIGLLASLFFSSTFVLNRAMSLGGGHWFWSASLRYSYMLTFLLLGLVLTGRRKMIPELFHLFRANWKFWVFSGSIGFGLFYSLLCFSASYAPGWVVATTWEMTILVGPLVLALFGRRVPIKALIFVLVIFAGILLVNLEQALETSLAMVLLGALPALGAAFAYPCGNQLVWEAQRGQHPRIPHIDNPLLDHAIYRMILMTLGTIPFWLLLFLLVQPPAPTTGQFVQTALVGLFSGVIATGLFLHARHLAKDAYQLSAIDATQSGEVVFTLLGEVLLLQTALPGPLGWAGVGLTLFGLVLYLQRQKSTSDSST